MWLRITNRNSVWRSVNAGRMCPDGGCFSRCRGRPCPCRQTVMKGRRMTDHGAGTEGGDDSSIVVPLQEVLRGRDELPVTFHRRELDLILRVFGRMVAAGEWRDYAIDHLRDRAIFSV